MEVRPAARDFFVRQGAFLQEYCMYFKKIQRSMAEKDPSQGVRAFFKQGLVDDHGVDCVIKKENGTFIEVQIKARSSDVVDGDAALFSAITHELTPNFYFVFYSERLETMWVMSKEEFIQESVTNKNGKHAGKHSIWFNGNRADSKTGIRKEYCKKQFEKYIAKDFSRFHT